MAVSLIPLVGGDENSNVSELQKVSSDENKNTLKVNAASKYKKKYKHIKYKKLKAYKYKRSKAAYKKAKYRFKTKYKYKRSKSAYKKTKYRVKTKYKSYSNKVSYSHQISSSKVSAYARCSCSLSRDYKVHHGSWANYCPYCHKRGTLTYTNGQGCPEGMFYCSMAKGGCDADFCIVHGKAHTYSRSKFLNSA